jgi:hypothetical protein
MCGLLFLSIVKIIFLLIPAVLLPLLPPSIIFNQGIQIVDSFEASDQSLVYGGPIFLFFRVDFKDDFHLILWEQQYLSWQAVHFCQLEKSAPLFFIRGMVHFVTHNIQDGQNVLGIILVDGQGDFLHRPLSAYQRAMSVGPQKVELGFILPWLSRFFLYHAYSKAAFMSSRFSRRD